MKSSKPPALATWLVERVSPGRRNEALAGDPLEQFSQGRSVGWYWRQVLVAIVVGAVKERLILAWASIFTIGWALWVNAEHFWNTPWTRAYFGFGASQPWFVSLISATASFGLHALLPLLCALCIYVAMNYSVGLPVGWNSLGFWRRSWLAIWRPLGRGYLVMPLGTILLLAFLPARRHPIFVGNIVGLMPVFFGLLVAMWSVPSNGAPKWTFKLFRIDPPSNWWIY